MAGLPEKSLKGVKEISKEMRRSDADHANEVAGEERDAASVGGESGMMKRRGEEETELLGISKWESMEWGSGVSEGLRELHAAQWKEGRRLARTNLF